MDLEGRKVIRVNDVRLDTVDGRLRLVAVDVGAAGLLRRLGIEGPFRTIARNLRRPCPSATSTGRTWTRSIRPSRRSMRVPHKKLAELHPADLASIIEDLAPRDRAGVLASLSDEALADVVEEMDPDVQVDILEDLTPERAADILEEMSPDDAADLVADLDQDTRDEILAQMEREEADEIAELLGYEEDTAGGMMTTEYIALPDHLTCAEAIDRLRELEPDAETIYYVYITNDEGPSPACCRCAT